MPLSNCTDVQTLQLLCESLYRLLDDISAAECVQVPSETHIMAKISERHKLLLQEPGGSTLYIAENEMAPPDREYKLVFILRTADGKLVEAPNKSNPIRCPSLVHFLHKLADNLPEVTNFGLSLAGIKVTEYVPDSIS